MTSVFVVEDSALIRQRLSAMLAEYPGLTRAGEAAGADAAIEAILRERPQVALLDLSLAQGGGFDVLRAVRDAAPEVDCYMLSYTSAYPYRQLAERLGARGYFDKAREFELVRELFASLSGSAPQPQQRS
jgi:DNA-binding NarL/FixJ family response regulator